VQQKPLRRTFVALDVATREAPAHPGDSIVQGGRVIGTVTSAAWGYRVGKNLTMRFVDPQYSAVGTPLDVVIVGDAVPAVVCEEAQYDPTFQRVRS